jgi:NAD(P)-dependent dehydrogenase (short-subunit alcohol dehydrogenase family)
MPGRLKDKVVIITGGASGYGKGISSVFIQEGAQVVIADLSLENAENAAKELGCAFVHADVTKRASWELALQKAVETYGGIDIVINNAGACYPNKV